MTMDFDLEQLGRWTDEREFVVTPEATIAYAAATNDELPAHLSGAVAPPMFAVVPALMGVATDAMDRIWVSKLAGDYDTRSLHGEQSLSVHEPIAPGMTLRSRAAPVGLERKSTGTLMLTRTETRDEHDRLLNTMTFVNFLRGIHIEENVGEPAPSLELPGGDDSRPPATITYHVDADQSFRYADASGDLGTYHIDDTVARAAGFPGVIVHGLCTMAFTARAIVESCCDGDSRRLRRLGVRFTRPLLPGQAIRIRIAGAGELDGRSFSTFEVDDESGEGVIRRGIAEVSS